MDSISPGKSKLTLEYFIFLLLFTDCLYTYFIGIVESSSTYLFV